MIISFVNKYCNEQVKTYDNYKYQVLLIGFLFHENFIYLKKMYNGRYILTFNISIPKIYQIEKSIPRYILVNHWIQLVIKYFLE